MNIDCFPNVDDIDDFPSNISFTKHQLDICINVLTIISKNCNLLREEFLRDLRIVLDPIVRYQSKYYNKDILYKTIEEYESEKKEKKEKQKEINKLKNIKQDKELINQTILRKKRNDYMIQLNKNTMANLYVLDGPVPLCDNIINKQTWNPPLLSKSLRCYICKKKYKKLHFFYDQLCESCGDINLEKRNLKTDLSNKICIVTGARIKIGFQTVLKLLRCGATVIGTTRFPYDAAQRYSKEKDFNIWKDNLHLIKLDLLDLNSINIFCQYIIDKWKYLHILINNACQTIKRPKSFYQHLYSIEEKHQTLLSVDNNLKPLLNNNYNLEEQRINNSFIHKTQDDDLTKLLESDSNSNIISNNNNMLFDIHGQPIDIRKKNSWVLQLDEISSVEFAQVFIINSIGPAILNSKLKCIMDKHIDEYKFIVNVSAMEGKFYRVKSSHHPHTNMAKAALNMMTRTSASFYRKTNIFMTSVDTGWINDERPLEQAINCMNNNNFQPPLDEIDAASRILDPIISPLYSNSKGDVVEPYYGVFLKNYQPTHW